MVMTLRERVPRCRSPSPTFSEEEPISPKKKTKKSMKPKPGRVKDEILVSESELEKENQSGYESIREQRMRENRERMQKLGILSLSSFVFKNNKPKNVKKKPYPPVVSRPSQPRRSYRLKDVPRANYIQTERPLKEMGIAIPDWWEPEVYTTEDQKLLGDCELEWALEVDGIGEDGDLMYDPANGTSCHQCRYKTLRKHTYCSKCRTGTGKLCGDCLYTRYGENVLEAVQIPKWLCPACRGICNCSRCRREKGWKPVTIQYSKVIELGFKSVAHYLILNRRTENLQKMPEDGTGIVDLTEPEKPASPRYECSDPSVEWSESNTDDSDIDSSKHRNKKVDRSVEKQADTAEPEASYETAGATCKIEVLQELNY